MGGALSGQPLRATGWAPVLGVIVALLVGASVLMGTVAFSGQRFFEWQTGAIGGQALRLEQRPADEVGDGGDEGRLAGMVSTQAQTMLPATPQRTADALRTRRRRRWRR